MAGCQRVRIKSRPHMYACRCRCVEIMNVANEMYEEKVGVVLLLLAGWLLGSEWSFV